MKLLDLQTGKYLELGRDWVYGGKDIYVIPTHYLRISKTDHVVKLYYDDKVEIINCELPDEYKVVNGIGRLYAKGQFSKYIINGKEYDMGYFTGLDSLTPINDAINDAKKCEKSEPPLELKEICEETSAVVYGGRYVLLSCETWLTKDKISVELIQGHIFRRKLSSLKYYEETPIFLIDKETLMKLSGIKDDYTTYSFETSCYSREFLSTTLLKSLFRGNIFEEYSKQLRNEPNKFDGLNQHFK